jgi:hypothetical protein
LPFAAMLIGCAGGVVPGAPNGNANQNPPGHGPHLMLTARASRGPESVRGESGKVTPFAQGNLTYRGGPVLQNVKVQTVFWGNAQFQSQLNSFYGAVVNSAYYDWLSEYNTSSPAQKIGRGSFIGSYNYSGATGTIDDSQIQSALGNLISKGSVPAPDANTLYAIHFAPGITITQGGSSSCQVFCAYHGSFSHGGKNVYYSVIPDQGGSCAGGCGSDPSLFNNTTSVSSHELVEATTDADVGQNDLAWYDDTNGEIGDICNAEQGSVAGYTVQKEWSNKQGACIVTNGSTPPPPPANDFSIAVSPTSGTVKVGSSASFTVSTKVTSGSATSITLGVGGLPSGVNGSFSPATVTAGGSSTLTLTASSTAASASASVTVTGNSSTTSHSASIALSVSGSGNPPPTMCSHGICSTGGTLVSTCDPCVAKICASDSYCCNTQWDSQCVGEVASICGQNTCSPTGPPPGNNCSHPICSTGGKLVKSCDPCATEICNADSYCCSTKWDSICVGEVNSICGQTCN